MLFEIPLPVFRLDISFVKLKTGWLQLDESEHLKY